MTLEAEPTAALNWEVIFVSAGDRGFQAWPSLLHFGISTSFLLCVGGGEPLSGQSGSDLEQETLEREGGKARGLRDTSVFTFSENLVGHSFIHSFMQ